MDCLDAAMLDVLRALLFQHGRARPQAKPGAACTCSMIALNISDAVAASSKWDPHAELGNHGMTLQQWANVYNLNCPPI